MTIFEDWKGRVGLVLDGLVAAGHLPEGLNWERMTVEYPRDRSHGDLSTNAAMVLAKAAGQKPRDLAVRVAAALEADTDLMSVEVAGPGFINMRLADGYWLRFLGSVLERGAAFASPGLEGPPVNVEYVSANPTGPMHVGHCRGAVFGDALARLLEYAGRNVTREYYINDAGAQVDVLARSAFLRYREALGEDVGEIPEGLYPGDYLKSVGAGLAEAHGPALQNLPEADWLSTVRAFAIDAMMTMIRNDLAALNIRHDVFFSERTLASDDTDRIAAAIDTLRAQDLVYEGRLDPPKGQLPDDWEDREQTLFRSSRFGDDTDRPLLKSDGSYTYFAADIAYHYDKFLRGFPQMIDIWGADHGGYVKRMKGAVTAVTGGAGALDIELSQLVRLFRDGEPFKMSKRAGEFVTLRDVVEEVGRDAVRFMMLYRKSDAPLDFDFAKVTEQSKDNPVFYVQYAHARAHSVFRQAREAFSEVTPEIVPEDSQIALLERLSDPVEIGLIRTIAEFPALVQSAAQAREPHRIAFYLNALAGDFHAAWNRGKEAPQLRFINADDRELTKARLAMVKGVALVLATGLDILGVSAPETM
ncbi:MAG: arginine--tRNA ligase [Pseudomonadota bacterium]